MSDFPNQENDPKQEKPRLWGFQVKYEVTITVTELNPDDCGSKNTEFEETQYEVVPPPELPES